VSLATRNKKSFCVSYNIRISTDFQIQKFPKTHWRNDHDLTGLRGVVVVVVIFPRLPAGVPLALPIPGPAGVMGRFRVIFIAAVLLVPVCNF